MLPTGLRPSCQPRSRASLRRTRIRSASSGDRAPEINRYPSRSRRSSSSFRFIAPRPGVWVGPTLSACGGARRFPRLARRQHHVQLVELEGVRLLRGLRGNRPVAVEDVVDERVPLVFRQVLSPLNEGGAAEGDEALTRLEVPRLIFN